MKARWTVAVLVLGMVAGFAQAGEKPPKAVENFTLQDQDGKNVSLSDFQGKVVVLEWINWECPFVKRHKNAGTMKKLAAKYANEGVVWLGINSTKHHSVEVNKKHHKKYELPYPVLDDHEGTVGRRFGAKTTPHMIVLDKRVQVVYDGAIDDDPRGKKLKSGTATNYVDQALTEMLAGKKVSVAKTRPYGCSVKYAPAKPEPKGKRAPGFTLTDQEGNKVSLDDFKGKIVVLEWLNPDCPVSMRHQKAKTFVNLASKYRVRGVVWLAINTTHYWNREKNKAFAEKFDLPYPILDDHEGKVGRLYGARTTPDMRVLDKNHVLVYSGAIDDDPRGRKLKEGKAKNYVDEVLAALVAGKEVEFTQTKPYGCSVKYAKKK